MAQGLTDRIEQRLRELHLSPRAASLRVSKNPDLIRNVLRYGAGANPRSDTLQKIAEALETTPTWLQAGIDGAEPIRAGDEFARAGVRLPPREEMTKDVPVLGTAMGSMIDEGFEGFELVGDPVDYVRRPPALANVSNAYAIYVTGDSMDPLHGPGELRFVNPNRPPAPGDTVVVRTRRWEHDPGQGYIKILRRRNGDRIVLEQLNPRATIEIPLQYVVSVHRVLTTAELFGV